MTRGSLEIGARLTGWTRGMNRGWAAGLLVTLAAVGCSSGPSHPPTYPVSAKLLVGSEPPTGAVVVLHPRGQVATGVTPPVAKVSPDGSLVVTTFDEGDGAPEGEYAVTIEWRKLLTQNGEPAPGPNVVPDQYASPDSTPIKISVKPDGPNDQGEIQIKPVRR